ncbi:DedA family protein [Streptomyces violaceus]|uniref:DedA family protein n=1 Tax=Streptomyces violaceus TaxID=1936 RepID=UPI00380BBE93
MERSDATTPYRRRLRLPSWVTGGRWIARIGLPDSEKAPAAAPGGRLALILLLATLAVIWSAETVAKASLPLLVRDHPLLLIALDARAHDLLLASPKVGTTEFIMVGLASRFTVHWLYYLLGRWYGDAALRWVACRSRFGSRAVDRSERAFRRYAFPAVFLLSNKPVCVLAGTSGMVPVVFVALHLPGTVLRIVVLRLFARSGNSTFSRINDIIERNAVWLTVLFVVATVIWVVVTARWHMRGASRMGNRDGESERREGS